MLHGFLLTVLACGGDTGAPGNAAEDAGGQSADDDGDSIMNGSTSSKKDAGGSATSGAKDPNGSAKQDAGASKTGSRDGGTSTSASTDGGAAQSGGPDNPLNDVNAAKDGGGGPVSPDHSATTPDAGSSTSDSGSGTRDPNGPCEDLQLLCFDIFDMFIINPDDCFTCNQGMGCQGCAIPFAY